MKTELLRIRKQLRNYNWLLWVNAGCALLNLVVKIAIAALIQAR